MKGWRRTGAENAECKSCIDGDKRKSNRRGRIKILRQNWSGCCFEGVGNSNTRRCMNRSLNPSGFWRRIECTRRLWNVDSRNRCLFLASLNSSGIWRLHLACFLAVNRQQILILLPISFCVNAICICADQGMQDFQWKQTAKETVSM